jgi:hypothetical protein
MLERGAEHAAEKRRADAFDAVFGFDSDGNELIVRPARRRTIGERFIDGQADNLRADMFDLHIISIIGTLLIGCSSHPDNRQTQDHSTDPLHLNILTTMSQNRIQPIRSMSQGRSDFQM